MLARSLVVSVLFVAAACAGCSSSDGAAPAGAAGASVDGGDGAAACAAPGGATPGPADTHCTDADGGSVVQPTSAASCTPDGGAGTDAGVEEACPFGDTMFGQEADDDDCKYHVRWTSEPVCQGAGGVRFAVTVTRKSDGAPATGAMTMADVFTTSPADAACDDASSHAGPNSGVILDEGAGGTYTGALAFDQSGAWTVRFHFYGECEDALEDSPHGHAAFHVSVP